MFVAKIHETREGGREVGMERRRKGGTGVEARGQGPEDAWPPEARDHGPEAGTRSQGTRPGSRNQGQGSGARAQQPQARGQRPGVRART